MKIYKNSLGNIATVVAVAAFVVGLAAFASPASTWAKNDKGNGTTTTLTSCPTGSFGHLIAPGWIKHHGETVIPAGCDLPSGIEKKYDPGTTPPGTTTDMVAPVISGIVASTTSTSSAMVTWNTNELANSKVYYDTTNPLVVTATTPSVSSGTLELAHSFAITGLSASTTYRFVIVSADASGNASTSTEGSFTTPAIPVIPDTTPPVIFNLGVTDVASSSASVNWNTDESATSIVWYGTTTPVTTGSPSLMAGTTTLSASHSVDLSGLTASTTYYFIVRSADQAGNTATISEGSFITAE